MLGFGRWQTKNAGRLNLLESTQDVEQVLEEEFASESQVADVVLFRPDAFQKK